MNRFFSTHCFFGVHESLFYFFVQVNAFNLALCYNFFLIKKNVCELSENKTVEPATESPAAKKIFCDLQVTKEKK